MVETYFNIHPYTKPPINTDTPPKVISLAHFTSKSFFIFKKDWFNKKIAIKKKVNIFFPSSKSFVNKVSMFTTKTTNNNDVNAHTYYKHNITLTKKTKFTAALKKNVVGKNTISVFTPQTVFYNYVPYRQFRLNFSKDILMSIKSVDFSMTLSKYKYITFSNISGSTSTRTTFKLSHSNFSIKEVFYHKTVFTNTISNFLGFVNNTITLGKEASSPYLYETTFITFKNTLTDELRKKLTITMDFDLVKETTLLKTLTISSTTTLNKEFLVRLENTTGITIHKDFISVGTSKTEFSNAGYLDPHRTLSDITTTFTKYGKLRDHLIREHTTLFSNKAFIPTLEEGFVTTHFSIDKKGTHIKTLGVPGKIRGGMSDPRLSNFTTYFTIDKELSYTMPSSEVTKTFTTKSIRLYVFTTSTSYSIIKSVQQQTVTKITIDKIQTQYFSRSKIITTSHKRSLNDRLFTILSNTINATRSMNLTVSKTLSKDSKVLTTYTADKVLNFSNKSEEFGKKFLMTKRTEMTYRTLLTKTIFNRHRLSSDFEDDNQAVIHTKVIGRMDRSVTMLTKVSKGYLIFTNTVGTILLTDKETVAKFRYKINTKSTNKSSSIRLKTEFTNTSVSSLEYKATTTTTILQKLESNIVLKAHNTKTFTTKSSSFKSLTSFGNTVSMKSIKKSSVVKTITSTVEAIGSFTATKTFTHIDRVGDLSHYVKSAIKTLNVSKRFIKLNTFTITHTIDKTIKGGRVYEDTHTTTLTVTKKPIITVLTVIKTFTSDKGLAIIYNKRILSSNTFPQDQFVIITRQSLLWDSSLDEDFLDNVRLL